MPVNYAGQILKQIEKRNRIYQEYAQHVFITLMRLYEDYIGYRSPSTITSLIVT